jgi:Zn-dependent protease
VDDHEQPLPPKLTAGQAPPALPPVAPRPLPPPLPPPLYSGISGPVTGIGVQIESVPRKPSTFDKIKKALGPFGVVLVIIAKFAAKIKFLILPILKFLPILLKTGGSMLVTVVIYAMIFGWWYAFGFVLLIFVHECGHLLAAKRIGLKVGAPVFIPFMGAFIALKEAPKNAWIEAQVGIGGPILGTVGAVVCEGLYLLTGNELFRALAFIGFYLNLFNLTPVGFLDGGRVATALSPWMWVVGIIILGWLTVERFMAGHFNPILLFVFIFSLPRLFSLFRPKTEEEKRYYEVTPRQRFVVAVTYFGLIAFLVVGMAVTYIDRTNIINPAQPSEIQ